MNKYIKSKGNRWKDLNGQIFGKWTILGYMGNKMWECRCECGVIKNVCSTGLLKGTSTSCGCFHKSQMISHNKSKTSEYKIWQSMKNRCTNKNHKHYKDYGGRGIKVCKEWLNSFEKFIEDVGNRPSKLHTLDRIDNNGNYCKENCNWATRAEQNKNKRSNVIVTFNGLTLILSEHIKLLQLPNETIRSRLRLGWSIEKAFNTPIKHKTKTPVTK